MDHPWRPTQEDLVALRAAVVKQHPDLADDEAAVTAMVERAVAFACKWEPHVFSSEDQE